MLNDVLFDIKRVLNYNKKALIYCRLTKNNKIINFVIYLQGVTLVFIMQALASKMIAESFPEIN